MDEREVVHALGQLGKQVAHPAATFAVLAERPPATLAIAGLRGEELELAIRIEGLAVALGELRLVVPRIDMTQPAGAKNLDDSAGLGGMVDGPGGERIRRRTGLLVE